jgi:tripartite-type tricarboxylate transporter receptor subunit TctC
MTILFTTRITSTSIAWPARRWFTTALATAALGLAAPAHAVWPEQPIRIVVPSGAGGSADAVARMVGERLGKVMGQPFVIENKGGGGGNIAAEVVSRAAPDGYTLLLTGNNHTINVSLFAKPPYKLEDFAPVVELTRGPSVFVAATNAPFTTLRELITKAKAAPGTIAYGGPGIGLPSHIAFELFQREAQINLIHVPYKGSGPSLADALGGQIPLVSSTLAAAMPNIKSGKLKALAVTSAERWPGLPDVPTAAEILGPSATPYSHLTWLGILAPKATPPGIVSRLNSEINKVLKDPEFKLKLEAMGTNPVGGTTTSFQKSLDEEFLSSRALIQSAKLRAD